MAVQVQMGDEPTIRVRLEGSVRPCDIPGLSGWLDRELDESDAGLVVIDAGRLTEADATAVDALARLQLVARRRGRQVVLRDPNRALQDLLALVGLHGVVPTWRGQSSGFAGNPK